MFINLFTSLNVIQNTFLEFNIIEWGRCLNYE